MKIKILLLSFAASFLCVTAAMAVDDFQYWSQYSLKLINTKKVDFFINGEGRFFNDASDVGYYAIGTRVSYDFWKYLNLGNNYTYLNSKSNNSVAHRSELKFQHRAEVELNPHWDEWDFVKLANRNRIEFRWIEDKGTYNTRSRHRITLTFPIKGKKFLDNIYTSSEFYYNWAGHLYDVNETVPFGLGFKLNDKTSLKTYYLIQHNNNGHDWSSNQVFGTSLDLTF